MYVRPEFEESRLEVLHELIGRRPFASFVTFADSQIVVDHLPFRLDTSAGGFGVLKGHVARANPLWRQLSDGADSLVVFHGPHAYITPSWYPSKHAHGKAVPTWNYVVVHARGRARAVEDRDWLLDLVTRLTDEQEAGRADPWRVSDAPQDYIERMLGAIVGVEMPIANLVGKWKVSQNRSVNDRLGAAAGLQFQADPELQAMAELIGSIGPTRTGEPP
jgi:transcriptional regulator